MEKRHLTWLPYAFAGGLGICWVIVILIDAVNFGGLGNWIVNWHSEDAPAFIILFSNGELVEVMQWSCLAASSLIAAQVSLLENLHGKTEASMFSLLFAVLFTILLMEDAGNLRTTIGWYIQFLVPEYLSFLPIQLLVYAAYSVIPFVAVLKYYKSIPKIEGEIAIFWIGIILYAVAALLSALLQEVGMYEIMGNFVNNNLFGGRISYGDPERGIGAGGFIMDSLIEESIELVGAILLLAYYARYRARRAT